MNHQKMNKKPAEVTVSVFTVCNSCFSFVRPVQEIDKNMQIPDKMR